MNEFGGGMRCVSQIRADGVAPVPVADARLHSHKDGPNTRRPHQLSRAAYVHQPKNAREHEGGALVTRAARLPSSLDSYTNNRNTGPDLYARPIGRGKHCGRFSIKGSDRKTGRTKFRRVNCSGWTCSYCGPRKAKLAKRAIRSWAEELHLCYFLTLTLDPSKLGEVEDDIRHLRRVFDKFRVYLRRKFDESPRYICVVEFTKAGIPHLHVLIDRYIEQRWISRTWDRLGGGRIVWIKRAPIRNISRYLAKYLTQDLLLSAPKGTRRITCARTIRLFPKYQSEIAWQLLRSSIWSLLCDYRDAQIAAQGELFQILTVEMDEENFLKAFSIPLENRAGGGP